MQRVKTDKIEQYVFEQLSISPKLGPMMVPLTVEGEYPELQSFAIMGLNEEAGEVAGLACRECYKHIRMPKDKWLEELGDVLWYLTAAVISKGMTLEEIFNYNLEKLEKRYGKFRDLED